jgi:dTDP-4-dehydrorhamnose 3,5-epimerase
MIFLPTEIEGAHLIDLEPIMDDRGFFARSWCQREFLRRGLVACVVQTNIAQTHERGTLRGLHYQAAPHAEAKLVRCTHGAAFVVAVDLRRDSPSYLRWIGTELTAKNRRALYVPPDCAQGYQTLADQTEVFYQMSEFYVPEAARGLRYDDPAMGINWPLEARNLSPRDRTWPPFRINQP